LHTASTFGDDMTSLKGITFESQSRHEYSNTQQTTRLFHTVKSLTTLVKWMEVFNGMYVCMYAKYSIVGSRTICTHWRLKY